MVVLVEAELLLTHPNRNLVVVVVLLDLVVVVLLELVVVVLPLLVLVLLELVQVQVQVHPNHQRRKMYTCKVPWLCHPCQTIPSLVSISRDCRQCPEMFDTYF